MLERGDHGSTFAGGPIAAAAALAALDVIDDAGAPAQRPRARRRISWSGSAALDGIAEVRGRGLMVGVSLDDGLDAGQVAARALEAGLVINVPDSGMLRFLPPLVIAAEDVDSALAILTDVLA